MNRKAITKLAVKSALKAAVKPAVKAAIRPDTRSEIKKAEIKVAVKAAAKTPKSMAAKAAIKTALKPVIKDERIHSHPTMCLHCHLIVEMFHERGADPVKGAWQCPRCAHKYLFSHWKIKRQARGKSEAA